MSYWSNLGSGSRLGRWGSTYRSDRQANRVGISAGPGRCHRARYERCGGQLASVGTNLAPPAKNDYNRCQLANR